MTMRRVCFCVSAAFLLACSEAPQATGDQGYVLQPEAATDFGAEGENARLAEATGQPAVYERKLVKTGSLSIEVDDVDVAAARVKRLVDSLGGYVAQESSSDYGRPHRQLTLKLPVARFEGALPRIEASGLRVLSREISVVDRTAEYVDTDARLRTQRALAARLRQLIAKADAVEDVIEVERELARVTGEIERFEARLKGIDRLAAYATLTLSLRGPEEEGPVVVGFFQEAGQSLSFGVDFLRTLVLGLLAVWPLWIVVGVGAWWWRANRMDTRRALETRGAQGA